MPRGKAVCAHLEQETIARLLLNRGLDAEHVRHRQVIADDLDAALLREVSPRLPVILVEGILDRHDRVLLDIAEVEVRELLAGDPLRGVGVGVLEVEVVLAVLVELRGSDIEGDLDAALVAGLLDGLSQELEGLLGARDVGGESSLITDVDGCRAPQREIISTPRIDASEPPERAPSMPYLAAMTFLRVW